MNGAVHSISQAVEFDVDARRRIHFVEYGGGERKVDYQAIRIQSAIKPRVVLLIPFEVDMVECFRECDLLQSGRGGGSMAYRMTLTCLSFSLLLFSYLPADAGSADKHSKAEKEDSSKKIVYVCACMKDKSCSCMTEAKMEGPCACGTQGGPPMKAVGVDSDWAKENREALAK